MPTGGTNVEVSIHRKRGRPRRDEDATSIKKTVLVPLPLWEAIARIAEAEGVTPHAVMREAIAAWVWAKVPPRE